MLSANTFRGGGRMRLFLFGLFVSCPRWDFFPWGNFGLIFPVKGQLQQSRATLPTSSIVALVTFCWGVFFVGSAVFRPWGLMLNVRTHITHL